MGNAAPAPVTIMPGDPIDIMAYPFRNKCSVAAPARDNQGNHYILTSGHCVTGKVGEIVGQVIYFNNTIIGRVVAAQYNVSDFAVIKLLPTVRVGMNDVPHHAYLGKVGIGEKVCFHGAHSGIGCGTVTDVNIINLMRGSAGLGFINASYSSIRSTYGNSGAAVYTSKGVWVLSAAVTKTRRFSFPSVMSTVR